MPRFPDDWIAPGEYRWCASCGLVMVAEGVCPSCREHRGGGPATGDEIAEAAGAHRRLRAERDALAARRRREGVGPLFWINEPARTP